MKEDQSVEQARQLLTALYEQVSDISLRLEIVEARNRRSLARGNRRVDPRAGDLRRELYEAHRLIDGLHRRFPETCPQTPSRIGRHTRSPAIIVQTNNAPE